MAVNVFDVDYQLLDRFKVGSSILDLKFVDRILKNGIPREYECDILIGRVTLSGCRDEYFDPGFLICFVQSFRLCRITTGIIVCFYLTNCNYRVSTDSMIININLLPRDSLGDRGGRSYVITDDLLKIKRYSS